MASQQEWGKKGEDLAAEWLTSKQYKLLFRNWRHSHYEVDIIAHKNHILHFIEVKTRRSNRFGYPEESVDEKKIRNLMHAADEFLYRFPEWKRIQYNVLAIVIRNDDVVEYFFIEDVYL